MGGAGSLSYTTPGSLTLLSKSLYSCPCHASSLLGQNISGSPSSASKPVICWVVQEPKLPAYGAKNIWALSSVVHRLLGESSYFQPHCDPCIQRHPVLPDSQPSADSWWIQFMFCWLHMDMSQNGESGNQI